MRVRRLLGLGLLGAGLSTSIVTAATFDSTNIVVWAWSGETAAGGYDAGYVEVRNTSSYWVQVRVKRKLRNPPAHYGCPGCEAACDGSSTINCAFQHTDVLTLAPGVCDIAQTVSNTGEPNVPDCMPNHNDSTYDCCDNNRTCSKAVKVCSGNLVTPCTSDASCNVPGAPGGICIFNGFCEQHPTINCNTHADCPTGNCRAPRFCSVYTTVEVSVIAFKTRVDDLYESIEPVPICSLYQATYKGGPADPVNEDFDGTPTCGHSGCSSVIRSHCQ